MCVFALTVLKLCFDTHNKVCYSDMKSPRHVKRWSPPLFCEKMGDTRTHAGTIPSRLKHDLRGREWDICQTDFCCSSQNPPFIRSLILSCVHLRNIKSWFMEMSNVQNWGKELLVVTSCPSKLVVVVSSSWTQLHFEPQSTVLPLDGANYRHFSCTVEGDTELDLLWQDTNPSSSTQIKVPVQEHLSPVSVQLYTYDILWHI